MSNLNSFLLKALRIDPSIVAAFNQYRQAPAKERAKMRNPITGIYIPNARLRAKYTSTWYTDAAHRATRRHDFQAECYMLLPFQARERRRYEAFLSMLSKGIEPVLVNERKLLFKMGSHTFTLKDLKAYDYSKAASIELQLRPKTGLVDGVLKLGNEMRVIDLKTERSAVSQLTAADAFRNI